MSFVFIASLLVLFARAFLVNFDQIFWSKACLDGFFCSDLGQSYSWRGIGSVRAPANMKPLSLCQVFDDADCDNGAKATQTNRVDCAVVIILTMGVSNIGFHEMPRSEADVKLRRA